MTSRTEPAESAGVRRMRAMLAAPSEIVIDGATAYWLGTPQGQPIGPESSRSVEPCALVLELVADGVDPECLMLWVRVETGQVHDVGGGVDLVGVAESAAGIPPRPRTSIEAP